MNSSETKLKDMALAALAYSYSPYSQKRIGAGVVLSNGKMYSGCNIENASYGGTVCAERVAVWKAYSENKSDIKITAVVVASEEQNPWPPCGFCRQVLAEFIEPDARIILVNAAGQEKIHLFKDLLPEAFEPSHLLKK